MGEEKDKYLDPRRSWKRIMATIVIDTGRTGSGHSPLSFVAAGGWTYRSIEVPVVDESAAAQAGVVAEALRANGIESKQDGTSVVIISGGTGDPQGEREREVRSLGFSLGGAECSGGGAAFPWGVQIGSAERGRGVRLAFTLPPFAGRVYRASQLRDFALAQMMQSRPRELHVPTRRQSDDVQGSLASPIVGGEPEQ